ncbi:methylmalonyl Co-A mutase-associated GTPase MeaB [Oceanibacterium hippocampi]|uniref:Putative GTPase/MT1543 n=1 Tax=Oceanibacterium hippocampi TaxID=745714 RepID=A0A1Y5TZS2_9PROT|nr:methylmalonyl Co-A mutase-associated GTPase MeaB [Oceanibacterium hippocampi]SLN77695.1 putative GTPase/MT1543 [Oceanibacterium hippocampi]
MNDTARPGLRPVLDLDAYVAGVRGGERAVLARAITLVESRKADHRALAEQLLNAVLPETGRARRIGITGVPGVGKSTFIEALGTWLTAKGHRVAVLAVDPTSRRTGGSILGDKTRMAKLATDPDAFIRPSPTAGTLGGVARRTRESMLLCEAAGFDVVLVETVGVGQSETTVADMVDFFLVLALPGAGDELQGIKKGVVELADMIAVNKADGDNRRRAQAAALDFRRALHVLKPASPNWSPPVLLCSALEGEGLEAIWDGINDHAAALGGSGELAARRQDQQLRWMWSLVEERLTMALKAAPDVAALLPETEREVREGRLSPGIAADRLLAAFGLTTPKD